MSMLVQPRVLMYVALLVPWLTVLVCCRDRKSSRQTKKSLVWEEEEENEEEEEGNGAELVLEPREGNPVEEDDEQPGLSS